ncbi:MAG: AAA family ATPase, partial [Actinobacteria bacterium]|nr:AAA family ATPase [Actinomycetota bacterium]
MLIHRIELSNVKSFARADIPLGPGLTAITGENGAGKSTILEAIGYALFGFLPYRPLSGFMRHGEAAAEVAVEFTSGLDDRRYRVTRRLRRARARASGALAADAQPQAAILDVELGTTFAQRAEEVRTFLTEHLGDDGIAPEVVFEHVVGVPQGRLTADFLDPPNIRKNRFDPLLRTHEFQQAYEALLALVRHFELRRQAHATRAAALEGELKQVAALATRLEAAEAQARGVAAQLEAAASDLTQAGDAVRA